MNVATCRGVRITGRLERKNNNLAHPFFGKKP